MQVYRGLPILTNQGAGRLVGIWPLDRQRTVGEYQRLAHAAIDEAVAAGRTPIVVGGSGLYLRAALVDLELPPDVPAGERERWERLYDRFGGELGARAARASATRARRRRCIRTTAGASCARSSSGARVRRSSRRRPRLWTDETRHPTTIVGLDVPRDELERRIVARTRAMFEQGVEEEVRDAGEVVAAGARPSTPCAPAARGGGAEVDRAPHAGSPRTSGSGCAGFPGVVMVAGGARSVDEVADAVLEVARARQQLPAGRGAD